MPISFKVIRRHSVANLQMKRIRDETVKAVQPVLGKYVSERKKITDRFSTRPEYEAKVNVREGADITALILLKNRGAKTRGGITLATLLNWLFKTGTRAHIIRAKKPGGRLAFQGGSYNRITPLSGTNPGSGKSGGALVFRHSVSHPGFAPSPALDIIDKKLDRALETAMYRAVDNAFRQQ